MSREKILKRMMRRYAQSSKNEKGALLDHYCAVTGVNRKHAIVQFGGGTCAGGVKRARDGVRGGNVPFIRACR